MVHPHCISKMARNATNVSIIPPWLEKILNLNVHSADIFNLEFGHENFTLTFPAPPFRRGTLFCIESPPFKNSLKKGGANYDALQFLPNSDIRNIRKTFLAYLRSL